MMGGSEPASADIATAEIVWTAGGREGETGQGDTQEQADPDGAPEAVADPDKGDEGTGRESKAENILTEAKLGAETEQETGLKLRTEGTKGAGRDFAAGAGGKD